MKSLKCNQSFQASGTWSACSTVTLPVFAQWVAHHSGVWKQQNSDSHQGASVSGGVPSKGDEILHACLDDSLLIVGGGDPEVSRPHSCPELFGQED